MVAKQFLGNIKGPKGDTGSFGSVTADADNTTLDQPTVTVDTSGPDTAKNFDFHFKGLKGRKGGYYKPTVDDQGIITFTYESDGDATENPPVVQSPSVQGPVGPAAGFGEITAQITGEVGTPEVSVNATGPNDAKNLEFLFKNLKGQPAGFGKIAATVDNGVGIPAVTVKEDGTNEAKTLDFTFTNLKGDKGDRGGLTYKSFTAIGGTSWTALGNKAVDYDYIYYYDTGYNANTYLADDAQTKELVTGIVGATLMLFPLQGTSLSGCLQLLYTDNVNQSDQLGAHLYIRSIINGIQRNWHQVFPIREITTADIDKMIAGTYVGESNDKASFVEATELNYFVQKIKEI